MQKTQKTGQGKFPLQSKFTRPLFAFLPYEGAGDGPDMSKVKAALGRMSRADVPG